MSRRKTYEIVNILVLLAAVCVLGSAYGMQSLESLQLSEITVFFVAACLTFGLKLVRLYLVFVDTGLAFRTHALQFFKTLLVSLLLPFKLGDFFRIYCYGHHIQNYLRSFLAVVLDRFVDTLALACILFGMAAMRSAELPWLLYFLGAFLLVVMLCYAAFPSLYDYWSAYLLQSRATRQRLRYLKLLQQLHVLYAEFRQIVQGRLLILFLLSVLAWMAELFCITHFFGEGISTYLIAAFGLMKSVVQQQFVMFSILLVLFVMLAGYVLRWCRRRMRA